MSGVMLLQSSDFRQHLNLNSTQQHVRQCVSHRVTEAFDIIPAERPNNNVHILCLYILYITTRWNNGVRD